MINNYGGYDMDITTYTMILFCKLWAMSWAYMDGGREISYLRKMKINDDGKLV